MVHTRLSQWFGLVSFLLIFLTTEGFLVDITFLHSAVAKGADFYKWNIIRIRYCDGASFTGDVEAVDPATNLHFRGARIWQAVMEDLLAKGMKNAKNAILTGCSAGSLASILHCDTFQALLPNITKVKCISDAGFFINAKDIRGVPTIETFFSQIVETHGSAKNLPESCKSKRRPELCFFPQYVIQHVRTPIFIINAAYDLWQVSNILVPEIADPYGNWKICKANIGNCSSAQIKTMHHFRLKFLHALRGLGKNSESNGMFIDSCYVHCQTERQEIWFRNDSTLVGNKKLANEIRDWFYDDEDRPLQKPDCPYPCNPTCYHNVFNITTTTRR